MKNKKTLMYIIIVILIILVFGLGYLIYRNNVNKQNKISKEYTPEQEITDEQLRQTIVTLYFKNKNAEELLPEARQIDAKILLENPFKQVIEMLLEGPKNENLEGIIPNNTIINNIEIKGNIVYIDFSEDFIKDENLGKEREKLIIKSIVDSLKQFTEVNGIRILINGEENRSFMDNKVNFNENFS